MSIERVLVVFNADGTIKGIATYEANGLAVEASEADLAALLPHGALLAQVTALTAAVAAAEKRARDAEAALAVRSGTQAPADPSAIDVLNATISRLEALMAPASPAA